MNTIEKLKNLSIHDSPVYNLDFNFGESKIKLIYGTRGKIRSLTFQNVEAINIQDSAGFVLTEVYRLNCTQKDDLYEIELVFVTEISMASWRLSFLCKEVLIG
jgi:hypothetical protein